MRTAFHLFPALDHRSHTSKISSVAVTEDARTLYLGLSDGQIEEHSIASSQQGIRTSLRARKHIGKKVVPLHSMVPGFQVAHAFILLALPCSQCKIYVICTQLIGWPLYAMASCCSWTKSPWKAAASPVSRYHTCCLYHAAVRGLSPIDINATRTHTAWSANCCRRYHSCKLYHASSACNSCCKQCNLRQH